MFDLPKDNFILLETNKFDKDNRCSYLFSAPFKIIACYRLENINSSLSEIEDFVSKGYYAAGFVSYEAGFSFEDSLKSLKKDPAFPLLWFGIYRNPAVVSHIDKIDLIRHKYSSYSVRNLRPNISGREYIDNVKKIKSFIRKGDTYQVNYTFKYKFDFRGSAYSFYEDLKSKQSVSYSAFIKTPEFSILSLSPELFFRKDKNRIYVRPMKGTTDRGRDIIEDSKNAETLKGSLKNRSENIMIVDLLRNDLGRISKPGSVIPSKLFEVERYETLLQMVSDVKSTLKSGVNVYDLFKAIFPSGSVTGAPKISTMKIIDSLEDEPRRIYTGSIGFFAPGGKAIFNVAIRTLLLDNKTKKAEMGIGSGIVIDSNPHKEFEECKLKANFITDKTPDFKLIETILWNPEKGYSLLSLHVARLLLSAEYFNFRADRKTVIRELKNLEKRFDASFDYRIRLLLDRRGNIQTAFSRIDNNTNAAKVRFSDKKTCSRDVFLYHKTTNRELYDKERKRWNKKGYFDVIFTNEKKEVTEGAISNIMIKKNGFFYTPPLDCGLLNGVFRQHLFKTKTAPIKEKVLYKKDIESADEIYMMNSVRGALKVRL